MSNGATSAIDPDAMHRAGVHTSNVAWAQPAAGFFFALTGALIATSVVNIGSSGVPLFFLTLFVPVLAAPFAWSGSRYFPFTRKESLLLLSTGGIFLLLSITTFLHVGLDRGSPIDELLHAAIRLLFLVYFAVCIYYLRGETLSSCLRWLRRILTVLALYGIYQVPAKLLGLPLFLDWLRNNPSFSLYDFNAAGWVRLIRATSVYAEPSQCTVPVLALILLNFYLPAPRYSKWFVWIAAFGFALLTFSRTIWLAIIVLILIALVSRTKLFRNESRWRTKWRTRLLAAALVILALLMPLWAFDRGNYKADLSRQERAGSVVIGLHLVEMRPLIGSGWNSFEVLGPSYEVEVEGASPRVRFQFIQNTFVSYAEQAGVAGFLFALFPFFMMLYWSRAPIGLRMGSIFAFLAVAELGGDVAYSSLFWLWVAVVVNWPERAQITDPAELSGSPALDRLHTSGVPSLPR